MIAIVTKNSPLIGILIVVWLILLSFCALIGVLVVPVDSTVGTPVIRFFISSGKVAISLLFVLIWLVGWYKALQYLLQHEFLSADPMIESTGSENNPQTH